MVAHFRKRISQTKEAKREEFLFLRYPFPSSASHQAIQSPRQIQPDTIPNQATIPPRLPPFPLVFIVSSLSCFQPFRLLSSFSFERLPFSFVFRLSVASSQQGTKSSKVLTVERFVIRSRVSPPLYIHHRSYPFQSSFHASSRAVCFLSVSPSPFHRSIPLLFALPPLRQDAISVVLSSSVSLMLFAASLFVFSPSRHPPTSLFLSFLLVFTVCSPSSITNQHFLRRFDGFPWLGWYFFPCLTRLCCLWCFSQLNKQARNACGTLVML